MPLLWEEVLSQRHFGRGLRRTALLCCNYHSNHPIISWADWKLMRSLQLGSGSQVIRGPSCGG